MLSLIHIYKIGNTVLALDKGFLVFVDFKSDEINKNKKTLIEGQNRIPDFKMCIRDSYLYTAAVLFSRIKNKTADWVNLRNLWILRDCVRENYNHGIGDVYKRQSERP